LLSIISSALLFSSSRRFAAFGQLKTQQRKITKIAAAAAATSSSEGEQLTHTLQEGVVPEGEGAAEVCVQQRPQREGGSSFLLVVWHARTDTSCQ